MSLKPAIFISAVSKELRSARDLTAKQLHFLGYEPVWQEVFGTEQGDIRQMLREKIDPCAGLVQLIGHCYGFEPPAPDEHFGRVSYTQFEARYAREREKKVWYIIIEQSFPCDQHDVEPDDVRDLQKSYRERLEADSHIYYRVNNPDALRAVVLGMRDELAPFRRRARQLIALVLGLIVLIVIGIAWAKRDLGKQQLATRQSRDEFAKIEGQNNDLLRENEKLQRAIEKLPQTLSQLVQAGQREEGATRLTRAYAELEKRLQLPKGTLQNKLPSFARQLLERRDIPTILRSKCLFALKRYDEAESEALRAQREAVEAKYPQGEDAIEAFDIAGRSAEAQTHYPQALEHYRAAAALTNPDLNPIEWASVQDGITGVLLVTGHAAEAEKREREGITVRERVLGAEHRFTLGSRNNLAVAFLKQGKYAEAEVQLRSVQAVLQRLFGAEDSQALASRINLAIVLKSEGKYIESENEARAALAIGERTLGPEDRTTLATRSNLATVLYAQGRYTEGMREERTAISVKERVFGAEDPDTLTSRTNLASASNSIENHSAAEKEHRAILAIRLRKFGPAHPSTLTSRENLAIALCAQRKCSEAEKEYRAVLALREHDPGFADLDTFRTCYNLAICLNDQNKPKVALEFVRRAVRGFKETRGGDHAELKNAEGLMGQIEARWELEESDKGRTPPASP